MSVALSFHRSLHKRPGGWTPAQLGTLSLWLDADDATTITIATGVSQWNDKSGNSRNATQATGANQPSLVTGARSGRAVLRFASASQQTLGLGDILDFLAGGLSVMAVGNSSGVGNARLLSKSTGTADAGDYALGDRGMFAVLDAVRDARQAGNYTAWQVIGAVMDRQTGIASWRDGAQIGSVATGFPNTTSYNSTDTIVVGGITNSNWNGDIGEIVLSLATWTTDERQQVEGYLAHKWGTTASLPSGHPYKSVAP